MTWFHVLCHQQLRETLMLYSTSLRLFLPWVRVVRILGLVLPSLFPSSWTLTPLAEASDLCSASCDAGDIYPCFKPVTSLLQSHLTFMVPPFLVRLSLFSFVIFVWSLLWWLPLTQSTLPHPMLPLWWASTKFMISTMLNVARYLGIVSLRAPNLDFSTLLHFPKYSYSILNPTCARLNDIFF